ncbi:MAG: hypothetical protein LUD52_04360, partial [Opitutae bacterium]|nr:hypothetical protein [Opitutae bacterium]
TQASPPNIPPPTQPSPPTQASPPTRALPNLLEKQARGRQYSWLFSAHVAASIKTFHGKKK